MLEMDSKAVEFSSSTFAVFCCTFWGFTTFNFFLDRTSMFDRYRIQFHKPKVSTGVWTEIALTNAKQQVLLLLVLPLLYQLLSSRGLAMEAEEFDLTTCLCHLVYFALIEDFSFYWTHRFLHTPMLWKLHAKHHKYTQPVGPAALIAHPIETLLGNHVGVWLGPWYFHTHMYTVWAWVVVRGLQTLNAHCGYHLPFAPSQVLSTVHGGAPFHDLHHSAFNGNYGSFFTFWDKICGTYVNPDSLQNKRKTNSSKQK